MATQNVCKYNKYGYCRYKDKCRKLHVDEICDNISCDRKECLKRHPKNCKFFRDFNYCKFGEWCKFVHIVQENLIKYSKNENQKILTKLSEIDKELEALRKEEESIKNVISEDRLIQLERKLDNFLNLEKQMCEKDELIENLAKKVNEMEEKLISIGKITESLHFKCTECDFSSTSEKGLKTHIKKKHDKTNDKECTISFPKQCDLCEKTIENKIDLKVHMKTHSYIRSEFKCEECEYCSETKLTMEVHIGKQHDPKFECGLCGYENLQKIQ